MNKNKADLRYDFNSFNLILFIIKHIKILIAVSVLAAVISAVVSLLIEEKYKSSVILFPTTSGSISKSLLTNNVIAQDILEFGEEEEAEQMLQVLHSDEIKNKIITKFNLQKHYEIKDDDPYKYTNLSAEYNKNINVRRTEFMSVEIEVLDKDPKTAADIANKMSELLDSVMDRMQKERAIKALKIVEDEYYYLEEQIKSLEDSLTKIRRLGVNDYESQSEVFNAAYAEALSKGAPQSRIEKLEEKLKILSEYGGTYMSLSEFLKFQKEEQSDLKAKYAEAKVDAEQILPHKFVVNRAFPAEKKSYPIRWLIVVVSTFSAGLFTLLALIAYETVMNIINEKK